MELRNDIVYSKASVARLKPILKWPGGKSSELNIIKINLPDTFDNYYEPFVGGGAVWLSLDANRYFINDISTDLIELYQSAKTLNIKFISFLEAFSILWKKVTVSCKSKKNQLVMLYKKFRENNYSVSELEFHIGSFFEHEKMHFFFENQLLKSTFIEVSTQKFKRIVLMESKKGLMPEEDYIKNIETAFKSSLYMFIRKIHNQHLANPEKFNKGVKAAAYFIIRDLCYSGMFRYNKQGQFNVPYGGIAYNNKSIDDKISRIKNDKIQQRLNDTEIYNIDFVDFLEKTSPKENDFVFLDPPYDTEFSNYHNIEFLESDQKRLADFLCNKCVARWMVVIKKTKMIEALYKRQGIKISYFDKRYAVSFKSRNEPNVSHMVITNY